MQVLIEGLALAAFSMIRDYSGEPLAKALNTYVMQDEARHVAFGRLALRELSRIMENAARARPSISTCMPRFVMSHRESLTTSFSSDRRCWLIGYAIPIFSRRYLE